jgi:hypothetical protein
MDRLGANTRTQGDEELIDGLVHKTAISLIKKMMPVLTVRSLHKIAIAPCMSGCDRDEFAEVSGFSLV